MDGKRVESYHEMVKNCLFVVGALNEPVGLFVSAYDIVNVVDNIM